MKFSHAFKEMDNHLKTHIHTITCHEIFEIKNDFYKIVEALCGSTANLTGITELLIFRFMYHALKMQGPIEDKSVQQGNIRLYIGNRYLGKNGKFQEPDIVIEQNNKIRYLLSIKNQLSTITPNNNEKASTLVKELLSQNGVYTTSIQDIYRIENIRHGIHGHFNSLTVIFSKVPQRHQKAIDLIHQRFDWHNSLVLENNSNVFLAELNNKIDFKINSV